jgi:hypothetical protein
MDRSIYEEWGRFMKVAGMICAMRSGFVKVIAKTLCRNVKERVEIYGYYR